MSEMSGLLVAKKVRAANLTVGEKILLADLCLKYRDIIDNERTDSMSSKAKEEGWQQLAAEFRAESAGVRREWQQLKNAYENMKQRAKKALSNDKVELHKTGGGTFIRQVDEVDVKMIGLLGYRATPLHNPFDTDASYHHESVNGEVRLSVSSTAVAAAASMFASPVSPTPTATTITAAAVGATVRQSPTPSTSATPHSPAPVPSTSTSTTTAIPPIKDHRQWARSRHYSKAKIPVKSDATSEISALAQFKTTYYTEKLAMKRQQHELFVKEHDKRMKMIDLQEEYYSAKLRKLSEE